MIGLKIFLILIALVVGVFLSLKVTKKKEDSWEKIKQWQNAPEFIRAGYEFVRLHTGKSPKN